MGVSGLAVSTLALSIWLVAQPVPLAAQSDGGERSEEDRLESYRALGFRSLVAAEIETRRASEIDAQTRARLSAELGGEFLRDGRPGDALRVLAPLRGSGWTRDLAWAVALRDAGYHEAALEAFEALAPRESDADAAEMVDYAAFLSGATALVAEDLALAPGRLRDAMVAAETDALRDGAERALLWSLIARGELDGALAQLTRGGSVSRLGASEIVLFLAKRFADSGRAATAETLYERASQDFRKSPASVAAFRQYQALLAARGVASDATLELEGADLAEAAGSWRSVLAFARAAQAVASTRAERDRARRAEGIALYNLGGHDEAISLLAALRKDNPEPAVARDALLTMARAERRRGRDSESAKLYERFVDEFPSDAFVEEVLWDQAWEHRRAGDLKRALGLFHEIATRPSGGKRSDEALFHEALMHAWRGDSGEAARDLERLTARSPAASLAAQTLFFRMRLARESGRTALAATLRDSLGANYRDTFYAVYLELEEGGPERPWHSASGDARSLATLIAAGYDADREEAAAREWTGMPSATSATDEGFTDAGARVVRRAERLTAAGLDDLAEAEIANVERSGEQTPWRSFLLSRACRRMALHHAALAAGSRFAESRPGRRPPEVARFLFPAAYADVAAAAAADVDMDGRFLLAIAREESWFDADVVSAAGAVGLSQLMPSTAQRVATRLGDPRLANDLTSPAANLRVGAAYFAGLTREFNGSPMLAAAGYNAGEAAVEKWRPYYEPDDVPGFIESISYTETRGYVKKILRSYWTYRSLYPMESDSRGRATQ